MSLPDLSTLETDPRFPSGKWTGFYLQKAQPGKHWMELMLTFRQGVITGEGRDKIGEFIVRGKYSLEDGKCHWSKRYLAKHDVYYQGFNEGRGIWGTWEIRASREMLGDRGGFHIWPEGMPELDPTRLAAEAELPAPITDVVEREEEVAAPVGAK